MSTIQLAAVFVITLALVICMFFASGRPKKRPKPQPPPRDISDRDRFSAIKGGSR